MIQQLSSEYCTAKVAMTVSSGNYECKGDLNCIIPGDKLARFCDES
jgi:hypothetical protein